jgi:hypothetical protein
MQGELELSQVKLILIMPKSKKICFQTEDGCRMFSPLSTAPVDIISGSTDIAQVMAEIRSEIHVWIVS